MKKLIVIGILCNLSAAFAGPVAVMNINGNCVSPQKMEGVYQHGKLQNKKPFPASLGQASTPCLIKLSVVEKLTERNNFTILNNIQDADLSHHHTTCDSKRNCTTELEFTLSPDLWNSRNKIYTVEFLEQGVGQNLSINFKLN